MLIIRALLMLALAYTAQGASIPASTLQPKTLDSLQTTTHETDSEGGLLSQDSGGAGIFAVKRRVKRWNASIIAQAMYNLSLEHKGSNGQKKGRRRSSQYDPLGGGVWGRRKRNIRFPDFDYDNESWD